MDAVKLAKLGLVGITALFSLLALIFSIVNKIRVEDNNPSKYAAFYFATRAASSLSDVTAGLGITGSLLLLIACAVGFLVSIKEFKGIIYAIPEWVGQVGFILQALHVGVYIFLVWAVNQGNSSMDGTYYAEFAFALLSSIFWVAFLFFHHFHHSKTYTTA